jgi:CPA2 family monovalent cation:H+ antiporter-2
MVLIVIVQPFLHTAVTVSILVSFVLISIFLFWKEAAELEGHLRAGAQVIAEALMPSALEKSEQYEDLHKIQDLLPGLGTVTPVRIAPDSSAAGKSIADLNVHALTGATIIAMVRGSNRTIMPEPSEALQPGDLLALIGSDESVKLARDLLIGIEVLRDESS